VMGGAAISALAATLAAATGATRLAFAFASDARLPRAFGRVDGRSGTPVIGYLAVLAVATAIALAFATAQASGTDTFGACGTVAVLALVLIYGAVKVAALRLFAGRWNPLQRVIPIVALVSLLGTFAANVFPVPAGPAALYPYVVVLWLSLGAIFLRDRRGESRLPKAAE